ncbi:DUF3298 domain-containing protein [Paenibacillaceae bacterium]|nr:DUF3298 domain-containing protein [Paenibacillaceae bacterium]
MYVRGDYAGRRQNGVEQLINDAQIVQLVKGYIPAGAELVAVASGPFTRPAVWAADLDGDGTLDVAGVYRLEDKLYLQVLLHRSEGWSPVPAVQGPGYQVSFLTAAPITVPYQTNLVVGWQTGAIWSKLSIYEWTPEGLRDVAPDDLVYSYIEIMDLPSGKKGADGQAEIVLWKHDTGEAYRVEIVRWQGGKLVPAPDTYHAYFPKVVLYYEQLVRKNPDYAFYWYYLADAQLKSDMLEEALQSARQALSLDAPYPSKETLQQLIEEIESGLKQGRTARAIERFPASVKTTSGTNWGYIDEQGIMKIAPQFDYAFDFQPNGLAIVETGNFNGVINTAGQFVVPPRFQSISPYSEGRAIAIDNDGFHMIDEAGRTVTKRTYGYLSSLNNNRAVFSLSQGSENDRYGYVDREGNEVIAAQFLDATDFQNNRAVVKIKDREYGLITPDGTIQMRFPYASVGPLGDGLLAFQREPNGKYGYVNEHNQVVIEPAYTVALPFQEGRAIVNTAEDYHSSYGLIDKQGREIIKPIYNEIRSLGEGRLAVGKAVDTERPYLGSRFAIADLNGQLLTDFRYADVGDFKQGLASVNDHEQTFFIDTSGMPAPGYPHVIGSGTLALYNGLIQANVDQRLSYLDRFGRVVWRQNTVIPLREPYRVVEEKYKPNRDYLVYYPRVEGMRDAEAERKVNDELKKLSLVKPIPENTKLDYSYTGDFSVTFFQKDLLVLELNGYNYPFGAAHGMPTKIYTHINLTDGTMYTLQDLFKPGSNYVAELSAIVGRQIKDDPQYNYVFPDTYKGIRKDQPFFVTEQALHLYFDPYDIAPYVAGFPTFTIPFAEIMNLIAVDGAFWRSFHG